MKRTMIAALAALTLASGAASAQGLQPSGTRAGGPGQAGAPGEIMPEHRTYLRGWVMKEAVPPVTMQQRVVRGYQVPPSVQVRAFPDTVYSEVPTARSYGYVRTQDDVLLVDPTTRQVIEVID
jgi:hypothetical protein